MFSNIARKEASYIDSLTSRVRVINRAKSSWPVAEESRTDKSKKNDQQFISF
jgi:hypothetical protein